jgi:hypothetical protein
MSVMNGDLNLGPGRAPRYVCSRRPPWRMTLAFP